MATVVPPAIQTANSAMKKWAQFLESMAMRAPGLVQRLTPGVVHNLPSTDRLSQVDLVRGDCLVLVYAVEDKSSFFHFVSLFPAPLQHATAFNSCDGNPTASILRGHYALFNRQRHTALAKNLRAEPRGDHHRRKARGLRGRPAFNQSRTRSAIRTTRPAGLSCRC